MTSLKPSPINPSLTHSDWTHVRYRHGHYGLFGIEDFNPSIRARHVAIYQDNSKAMNIREVMIYGKFIN